MYVSSAPDRRSNEINIGLFQSILMIEIKTSIDKVCPYNDIEVKHYVNIMNISEIDHSHVGKTRTGEIIISMIFYFWTLQWTEVLLEPIIHSVGPTWFQLVITWRKFFQSMLAQQSRNRHVVSNSKRVGRKIAYIKQKEKLYFVLILIPITVPSAVDIWCLFMPLRAFAIVLILFEEFQYRNNHYEGEH